MWLPKSSKPEAHVLNARLYRVYQKKPEQIGNRSQICKSADAMKFLVQIDYFGTYDIE